MKTVSVRITEAQAKKFGGVLKTIPGASLNGLIQEAARVWLETEAPVLEAAYREAQAKLKRQPVAKT